jgi:hypothetical protein
MEGEVGLLWMGVAATDVGLDWATPPKNPASMARIPKRSPSSFSRMFSSAWSSSICVFSAASDSKSLTSLFSLRG